MKAEIYNNNITFMLEVPMDSLNEVAVKNRKALTVYEDVDGEKEPKFSVGIGDVATYTAAGMQFDNMSRVNGYAIASFAIPDYIEADKMKEYVADKYLNAFLYIPKAEEQIKAALDKFKTTRQAAMEKITLAGLN